ncbi:LuxR family transcriptional regulator [Paenarthrobacter nitroguajacolicus]|uniref:LuxR family transcriptional regulator n=1 Tax=Paenarthrobacter nitroguajacolicus TaxID=211146 RepID=UPI00248C9D7A|nr:LuxR family transcriptional regulator [Paenarthrobacter nitroguajacolicus]MDI2033010.1 hypothetical protein [Paenarthrobacter nitroguajacolicus]
MLDVVGCEVVGTGKRDVEAVLEYVSPGRGVRITGDPGSGKTRVLTEVLTRLERSGRTVFLIRALFTHRNIPYAAIGRLDLSTRHGHPIIRLADNLAAQLTAGGRPVLLVDDFHHVDAHSLAVLEDALRRTDSPVIITIPNKADLSAEHLAVLSTRKEALVGISRIQETGHNGPAALLTPREAEIAALTATLSNWDIAERLHISIRTVENHISNVLRKTRKTGRDELHEVILSPESRI